MANKDKAKTNTTDTNTEQPSTVGTIEEAAAQPQSTESEDYKALVQRIQADFDNYRKRNNESIKNARIEGNNEVIISLLPVVDAVEIAIKVIPDEKSKEGVALILKQIQTLFAKYGITEICANGECFNPDLHNAVMQVEDEDNSGKVVDVLQKGYIRDGKVVRYAMVKVAK